MLGQPVDVHAGDALQTEEFPRERPHAVVQGSRGGQTELPRRKRPASSVPHRYAENPRALAARPVPHEPGQASHSHLSETSSQTPSTVWPSQSGVKLLAEKPRESHIP